MQNAFVIHTFKKYIEFIPLKNILAIFFTSIFMQHRILTANQLGLLLQAARKAGHFTQARLAAQMGLSQSRLSKIEHDLSSATVQQLLDLCSVLDIELVMQTGLRAASSPRTPTEGAASASEY